MLRSVKMSQYSSYLFIALILGPFAPPFVVFMKYTSIRAHMTVPSLLKISAIFFHNL